MAWEVRIVDERGKSVTELGIHSALDRRWLLDQAERYPWLAAIDPYGETTFNHRQLKRVTRELATLIGETSDPAQRAELESLMQWMSDMPDRHLYFKLVGD